MAETLAVEIAARPPGEQIVALIGNGHIAYRYGVPERALRRQNHSYRTVVTLTAPVASSSVTTDIADYVWVTATAPPPAFRGGLGIFAREAGEGEGILVVGVIPGGPAAQGDIRKGDILVSMDDHPLRRVEELTAILSASPPAAVHRFLLRRGAAVETATVSMPGAD
jgi:S1-C subfamily serine protease